MNSLRQLFLKYVAQTSETPLLLEVEKAEGVYLFGPGGRKYFDLISGVSVSNVGHCHPRVVKAISEQSSQYMHLMVYGEYVQYPQVRLAEKLSSLLPSKLNNIYFVNSGSEAVEGAIKLAKRFTGRTEVVSFKNAYHGSTHGALSLMGDEEQKRSFRPLLPDIRQITFNSFEDIELITNRTACVILEPIQGEAGIVLPDVNYLKKIRERCSEVNALLIFDEIQTGLGRTGTLFAFEQFKVIPDILLLAKALGGGLPLGAFISSKEVMNCLTHDPALGHITTFGGNPVCCAAALAALDVLLEEKLIGQVKKKEQIFRKYLAKHKQVKEIRSSGLFMAVELASSELVQKLIHVSLSKGVVLDWFLFCSSAFRIAPPLSITEDECIKASEIILESMDSL